MADLHQYYGWIPDEVDNRDFPYVRLVAAIPALPKKVDLRNNCSPIENQGKSGSCTAQALVGNLEYLKRKTLRKMTNFSRLFVYYNERVIRHTIKVDSGASLRDGIKTLASLGVCLEKYWPYKVGQYTVKPPKNAYTDGLNYQITSYYRISAIDEMKHCLVFGYPFVFGFYVYESLESELVTKTGVIPLPGQDEKILGGHAVMAIGYDDQSGLLTFRNSWGKQWGDTGYGYLPYRYLTDKNLSNDFWSIRDME